MHLSAAAKDVYSDLLVNLAWVLVVAVPSYFLEQDWLGLTRAVILYMLAIRVAIQLRKRHHDTFE
jgi:hypothetical protein